MGYDKRRRGFTLIELLVVIAIIAFWRRYSSHNESGRRRRKAGISNIKQYAADRLQ